MDKVITTSVTFIFFSLLFFRSVLSSDITNLVFGDITDGMPAAFGDFNSDELTDVFILLDNDKTVEILLAHEEEPLLRPAQPDRLRCTFRDSIITSVVPGDFDGDAFMDILVTTKNDVSKEISYVHIIWGGSNPLKCTNDSSYLFKMTGQPLAIDYNQDMIIDLFGQNDRKERLFWVFKNNRGQFNEIKINRSGARLNANHHSHAFLDLNEDYTADLFITTEDEFEVWYGNENKGKFDFDHIISHPQGVKVVGQSLFIDVELKGTMDLVTPICYDHYCKNSSLMVFSNGTWHNLNVNFKDDNGTFWRFFVKKDTKYNDLITLHSGDFNMDGYPDLLATCSKVDEESPRALYLENVACTTNCAQFKRSYKLKWYTLNPFKRTAMAAFFDFYQDGVLDAIIVTHENNKYKLAAFKNSLDYDANFIKIMVLTGLSNKTNPMIMGRVGKKRRTYGTNLPGPSISYTTTTQEGDIRHGVTAQLPQSAHFSLNLPYNIFGLGRTPNFVDKLTVGLSNHSRTWTQIIPNSQMVVIPWPTKEPWQWKAQLFVTPSKLILMSVAALTGVCGLITVIIGALYWKERQEDKKERLSESHRFHFDAM